MHEGSPATIDSHSGGFKYIFRGHSITAVRENLKERKKKQLKLRLRHQQGSRKDPGKEAPFLPSPEPNCWKKEYKSIEVLSVRIPFRVVFFLHASKKRKR
ncbi:hypothetical protein E2C01_029089 [Portunus trituberculatus]|uniref:Uncharacterized protein n=1 Tax=Portunus trituberculatus TaxID=210409 RepID=A0A5B7EMG2_PORTR|nr:hypothetical protein [Portunus trituberculatus]